VDPENYPIRLNSGGGGGAKQRWCARKVGWCAASGYLKERL
jgi:hypothetical protein